MITRDFDIDAYQLVHKLLFKYKWTEKDEMKLQNIINIMKCENPADYPGNRVCIFIDVLGKITFIERYFPERKVEE